MSYYYQQLTSSIPLRTPRRDTSAFDVSDNLILFSQQNFQKGASALSTGAWGIDPFLLHEEQAKPAKEPELARESEVEDEAAPATAQAMPLTPLQEALQAEGTDRNKTIFRKWWNFCKRNLTERDDTGSYVNSVHDILVKQTATITGLAKGRNFTREVKGVAMQGMDKVAARREPGAAASSKAVSSAKVPSIPLTEGILYATLALFNVARAHPRSFIVSEALSPEFLFYVLGFAMDRADMGRWDRYSVSTEGQAVSEINSWSLYNYGKLHKILTRLVMNYYNDDKPDKDVAKQDVGMVLFLLGFDIAGSINPLIMRLVMSYGHVHEDLDKIVGVKEVDQPNEYTKYDSVTRSYHLSQFDDRTIQHAHRDVRTSALNNNIHAFSAIRVGRAEMKGSGDLTDSETTIFEVSQLRFSRVNATGIVAPVFTLEGDRADESKTLAIDKATKDWAAARVPVVHAHMQEVSHPAPRFYMDPRLGADNARTEWMLYSMLTDNDQGNARMPASYTYFLLNTQTTWSIRPLSMIAARNVLISSSAAYHTGDIDPHNGFTVGVNIFSKAVVAVSQHTFISNAVWPPVRQSRSFFTRSLYGHNPNAHFMYSTGFVAAPGEGARLFNELLLKPFGVQLPRGQPRPIVEFGTALQKLKNLRRLIVEFMPPQLREYPHKNAENIAARVLPAVSVANGIKAHPELVKRDVFFALVDYYMRLGDALFMDERARTYWGKFLVPHTMTLCWPASLQASYFYLVEALLSPTIFAPFFYEPAVIQYKSVRGLNSLLSEMYNSQGRNMEAAGEIPHTWSSAAAAFSRYLESGVETPFIDEFRVLSARTYKHQLFFINAEKMWKEGTKFSTHNAMFATIVEPEINDTMFEKINTEVQNPFSMSNFDYLARPYAQWAANEARKRARDSPEEAEGELQDLEGADEKPEDREKRLWKQREDDVNPQDFPLLSNDIYLVLAERAIAMLAPDWKSNCGRNDSRVSPESLPSFFSALFQYSCLTPDELTAYSFGPIHNNRGVGLWHPTAAFDQSVANMEIVLDGSDSNTESWGKEVFYAVMAAPWRLKTADGHVRSFGRTTAPDYAKSSAGLIPRKNLYNTANFLVARSNGVKNELGGTEKKSKTSSASHEHFDSNVSNTPAMAENVLAGNVKACYPEFPCNTRALGTGFKELATKREKAAKTPEEKAKIVRDLFPVPIVIRTARGINRLPSIGKNDVPDFVSLFREGDGPGAQPHNPTPTVLTAILTSIRSSPIRTAQYRALAGLVSEETASMVRDEMQFAPSAIVGLESDDEGAEEVDDDELSQEVSHLRAQPGRKRQAEDEIEFGADSDYDE